MKPPIRHVIFDCDGTLIDSEVLANRVFARELRGLGLALREQDLNDHFSGLTDDGAWERIGQIWGLSKPNDFDKRFQTALLRLYSDELRPIDGAREMLASLIVPASVASNSGRERLEHALEVAQLLPYFAGRIYSSDDVARPKPAPDLYILAVDRSGQKADNCLVIEDSPTGVRAARAAGLRVIGCSLARQSVREHGKGLLRAGAEMVIERLDQLPIHAPELFAAAQLNSRLTPADGSVISE
jgi:HAD superfamily hydrolase (TIGR01509 family)